MITILSFDPGLSFSGWTYSVLDDSGTFTIREYGMLTPNKTVGHKEYREDVSVYGARVITLTLLRGMIRMLMDRFRPDFIVSEDAFFDHRHPSAYEALIHWILTVTFLLRDEYHKPLFKIPPSVIKKAVSGIGKSGKLDVQAAVLTHPDIQFIEKPVMGSLAEHEADSMAIGYTFIKLFPDSYKGVNQE